MHFSAVRPKQLNEFSKKKYLCLVWKVAKVFMHSLECSLFALYTFQNGDQNGISFYFTSFFNFLKQVKGQVVCNFV